MITKVDKISLLSCSIAPRNTTFVYTFFFFFVSPVFPSVYSNILFEEELASAASV